MCSMLRMADYKIRQDDGVFPVLTKNWKMGGLGHWRHLHSYEPPPNGAPASYLSPGWHDRSPHVGKGLNRDGDLVEKLPGGCPQISRSPKRVESGKFHRGSRDLGGAVSNPALKPKKPVFSSLFFFILGFWGYPPGGQHPSLSYSL